VNAGQFERLMARLDEIRDRIPGDAPAPPTKFTTHHLDGSQTVTTASGPERDEIPETNRKTGAHHALRVVLDVLDGWIEGAQEEHEAMEHRGRENTGEECWRRFAPSDIRRMVNDAARELDIAEFPMPTHPREDVK
jgi:hypothetical protein